MQLPSACYKLGLVWEQATRPMLGFGWVQLSCAMFGASGAVRAVEEGRRRARHALSVYGAGRGAPYGPSLGNWLTCRLPAALYKYYAHQLSDLYYISAGCFRRKLYFKILLIIRIIPILRGSKVDILVQNGRFSFNCLLAKT